VGPAVKVLVIAPHPDDEAIGCGGSICLHVDRGDSVAVTYLTSGELGLKHLEPEEAWRIREGEAEESASVLGVALTRFLRRPDWSLADEVEATARLVDVEMDRTGAELVYAPHAREWHPDHRAAAEIVGRSRAVADGSVPVRAYEVWTPLGDFDDVEDISSVMARKLEAVRAYGSQLAEFRYDRAVEGLNQYRGALAAHVDFAEVFCSP